jgi:hypothetical protein
MDPIDPSQLNGKQIALVLTDESDESAVFTGTGKWDGTILVMLRNAPDAPVEIRQEWFSKIRATPTSSKDDLLGAEFFIWLHIGTLPQGEDESQWQKTGLKWPD